MEKLTWQFACKGLKSPLFKTLGIGFGAAGAIAGIVNWVNGSVGAQLISVPVNLLVFASCAAIVAIALGLCHWQCPKEIREYLTEDKFVSAKLDQSIIDAREAMEMTIHLHGEEITDGVMAEFLKQVELHRKEEDPIVKQEYKKQMDNEGLKLLPKAVKTKLKKDWTAISPKVSTTSKICGILVIIAFAGIGYVFVANTYNLIVYLSQ